MQQTKTAKRSLLYVIFFSAIAITFGLIYYFGLIKGLNTIMAVSYVIYFVGLALIFNGTYCKETNRPKAKLINYLAGMIFILGAAGVLIYGFTTGTVQLWH